MAHLTLVLGGMRSGKSRFAEGLAGATPPVVYLATAVPGDDEMTRRIALHRERRAQYQPAWHCIEEPWHVARAVRSHGTNGSLLLDCLTLWVTNLLLGLSGRAGLADAEILAEVDVLAEVAGTAPGRIIIVSSEVGCGIIPVPALARRFGNVLGEANQRLAAAAVEVHVCLAGIPLRIK
jgi:adenosylcobinamide kinase / adenosylcobinamide-phosphate guanylyltransferase